jgi:hypothetical protein
MGRHRTVPAGEQHLALRDDPAPAAQDLTPRSSNCLISDAIAGAGRSISGWAAAGESAENSRRIFTVNASIDQGRPGMNRNRLLVVSCRII